MEVQQFDTRVQKGWGHAKRELSPFVGLSALSKVYEKVMYDQLYNTFCRHLSQNLSGFLKNHSCCTALLKVTKDWRRSPDNRESAMAVAVDLSKAFDSINHNFLLEKLKAYGFCESALSLMSSYLLGRKQRVCLHGVCSVLCWWHDSVCIRCLAHCPAICSEPGSQPPVGMVRCNYLLINNAKTQAIPIGPCKYDFDFTLKDSGVTTLPCIRILGVELDIACFKL